MPERVTDHEYDADGRLVRSVEYVESAWDEHERAVMLALGEYEAGLCQYCGGPAEVCQSKDADRNNSRATWIYWPTTPAECAVTTAARVWSDKRDPNDRRALIPKVVRQRRGTPRPPI